MNIYIWRYEEVRIFLYTVSFNLPLYSFMHGQPCDLKAFTFFLRIHFLLGIKVYYNNYVLHYNDIYFDTGN
jgi:hypothetical protein